MSLCLEIYGLQFCFSFICLFRNSLSCKMSAWGCKSLKTGEREKKYIQGRSAKVQGFCASPNLLFHMMKCVPLFS